MDYTKDKVDVVVIGAGLGGLTAANRLARAGYDVLLAERHSQIGGLAAFFRRRGHVFDVALHGFPVGMRKSLRKYWGREFADRVVQVKSIRFDNPQYSLESTFDTADFTSKLVHAFHVPEQSVKAFFDAVAAMNFYDGNRARRPKSGVERRTMPDTFPLAAAWIRSVLTRRDFSSQEIYYNRSMDFCNPAS